MTEHDGCEGCKYFSCDEMTYDSPCYECEGAHKRKTLSDNYTPMTNADKIRNMTDEELAIFLAKTRSSIDILSACVIPYRTEDVSKNLEWLQKKVEE